MLALTTIFVGTAVAKCSLGVFLLRFILSKWQRVVIWALMATVLVFATGAATALWINCLSWSTANLFHAGTLPHCSPLINFTLFLEFYGGKSTTRFMYCRVLHVFDHFTNPADSEHCYRGYVLGHRAMVLTLFIEYATNGKTNHWGQLKSRFHVSAHPDRSEDHVGTANRSTELQFVAL